MEYDIKCKYINAYDAITQLSNYSMPRIKYKYYKGVSFVSIHQIEYIDFNLIYYFIELNINKFLLYT